MLYPSGTVDSHLSRLFGVESGLSDMYFLRLRVRQSRSFSLSVGFLRSEFNLPYLTFPACHCAINRPDMYFCSHLSSLVFYLVSYNFSAANICCCFTV